MKVSDTANNAMINYMEQIRNKSYDNLRDLMFNPVPVRGNCLITLASTIIEDYDTVQYIMSELDNDSIEINESILDKKLQKYKFIKDNFHHDVLSVLQYLRSLEQKEYWVLINLSRDYSVSIGDETGRICSLYFTQMDSNLHILSPHLSSEKIHFKLFVNDKFEVLKL